MATTESTQASYPPNKAGWEALLRRDVEAFNDAHQAYRDDPANEEKPLNLQRADLQGAKMQRADLQGAKLQGADFTNTLGIIWVPEQAIATKTNDIMQQSLSDIEREPFDRQMLLVDQGDEGIRVKRGCLWKTLEDTVAHWHNYEYWKEVKSDDPRIQHRSKVMLPLLVESLQQAIGRHEEDVKAGLENPQFPKAAAIFADLKTKYGEAYPDLFTDTPEVKIAQEGAVHAGKSRNETGKGSDGRG